MKPEAIQIAAAEVLSQIENSSQPANEIINAYTRSRRYIGSKDRRTLTDLVWTAIRYRARLNYCHPNLSPLDRIKYISQNGIQDLSFSHAQNWVQWEVPEWLLPYIPNAEQELPALLDTADTILRVNGNRDQIRKQLLLEGIETDLTPLSPYGLRLKKRANLQGTNAYRNGLIEIQDEGSQCVALETGIKTGDTVLDYCAGAGGKSLIFAQMMTNTGLIVAHDISDRSLRELDRRAKRAKATCIQVQKHLKQHLYDHVVVDAPCSGTGTWRRCPDMRWKLTEEQLKNLIHLQATILDQASSFVKVDGFLSYMTCSITQPENQGQVAVFLKKHSDYTCIRQKQFSPAITQTDGLFVAVLQRTR